MRFHKVALSLALSGTLLGPLVACGDDGSSTEAEDAPTTVTQTTKKPHPSGTKTKHYPSPTQRGGQTTPRKTTETNKEPEEGCGELSAQQALNQNVGKVPKVKPDWEWDPDSAGTNLYDPCADLSPILIPIEASTSRSPNHIMLFHKGEYLGTATSKAYAFSPEVTQVDDQTVSVLYHYAKPGEGSVNRSGEAHATFTWDPDQQKVVMSGNTPPDY